MKTTNLTVKQAIDRVTNNIITPLSLNNLETVDLEHSDVLAALLLRHFRNLIDDGEFKAIMKTGEMFPQVEFEFVGKVDNALVNDLGVEGALD